MDANVIGLIIGVILAAITIWLILSGARKDKERVDEARPKVAEPVAPQKSSAFETPVVPVALKPDDLTIVEGIGPKIAAVLGQNGVKTFAQLAAAEISSLEKILKDNGLQFAKPASWPEQARLAAAGKMDELKALQDKLIAGR